MFRTNKSTKTNPYLGISPVCCQVDCQCHDLQINLLFTGVQNHPHDNRNAIRVGEHALHFVLEAQVVQYTADWVLNQPDKNDYS